MVTALSDLTGVKPLVNELRQMPKVSSICMCDGLAHKVSQESVLVFNVI